MASSAGARASAPIQGAYLVVVVVLLEVRLKKRSYSDRGTRSLAQPQNTTCGQPRSQLSKIYFCFSQLVDRYRTYRNEPSFRLNAKSPFFEPSRAMIDSV
jgi:hypothetical protein